MTNIPLPTNLTRYPDLDSWVRINADETITLFTGKVEIGQGIHTAIAQIGAEELDVALERIRINPVDTDQSPNEGSTTGSNSLQVSGAAVRQAAAEARYLLLDLAAEELEAPKDRLVVEDGTIRDPQTGQETSYWTLFGGKKFGSQISGIARPKDPTEYTLVGQSPPRLDLLAKVTGGRAFVHDLDFPGMVHGRVIRPLAYGAALLDVDQAAVDGMPGLLKLVQDGSFLGIIAAEEAQAEQIRERLAAATRWEGVDLGLTQAELYDNLFEQATQRRLIVQGRPADDPVPSLSTPADAAQTLQAAYYRPYQMHAALGPSAAVALIEGENLTVWTHSQGVYSLQGAIAQVLEWDETKIRVIHVEGPGCYGHNGADDAALDAALLARAYPGHHVSLKWTRGDEHRWEPYGPAMAIKTRASLDRSGQILDWNYDIWSYPHIGRPRPMAGVSGLLAAWHLAQPSLAPTPGPSNGSHSGSYRNADPLYALPRTRIVDHFVPTSPLRVSAMRSLGAYANVFAIESFIDELAYAAGTDPVEFRLRYLQDERAKAVIEAAAEAAGWEPRSQPQGQGRGRGIGFAQYKNDKAYSAVVIDLQADRKSGQIRLERAFIAADAGQVVSPDGLRNQLEGGLIQAASWTLKEAVQFDRGGVISQDWMSYPILTFPEIPTIETILLNRVDQPFLGAGEGTPGPTAGAIANALYDALGIRLREIPFTPARVKAA